MILFNVTQYIIGICEIACVGNGNKFQKTSLDLLYAGAFQD